MRVELRQIALLLVKKAGAQILLNMRFRSIILSKEKQKWLAYEVKISRLVKSIHNVMHSCIFQYCPTLSIK